MTELLPGYRYGENWFFDTKKMLIYNVEGNQFTEAAKVQIDDNEVTFKYYMSIPMGVIRAITLLLITHNEVQNE